MAPLPLTGRDLSIDNVSEVARGRRAVALAPDAADRMRASRAVIERLVAEGATVYGVDTGFGDLADVRIVRDADRASCSATSCARTPPGVGAPLPREVVRAMMLLRANVLAIGLSGVRVDARRAAVRRC